MSKRKINDQSDLSKPDKKAKNKLTAQKSDSAFDRTTVSTALDFGTMDETISEAIEKLEEGQISLGDAQALQKTLEKFLKQKSSLPTPTDFKEGSKTEKSKEPYTSSDSENEGVSQGRIKPGSETSATPGGGFTLGLRNRTSIGPQGEHASAYTLYQELIYEAVEDEAMDQSVFQRIVSNFKNLSPDGFEMEIAEEAEEIEKGIKKYIPRERRKEITKSVRAADKIFDKKEVLTKLILSQKGQDGSRENYDDVLQALEAGKEIGDKGIKKCLTISNQALISGSVSKIANIIIYNAAKMPFVSFPRQPSVLKNKYTNKERSSKDNLKDLNKLLITLSSACESKENPAEKISSVIDAIEKVLNLTLTKLDNQKPLAPQLAKKLAQDDICKKITRSISNLFWYPHIKDEAATSKELAEL